MEGRPAQPHLELFIAEGNEHSHFLRGQIQCGLHHGLVAVVVVHVQELLDLRCCIFHLTPFRRARKGLVVMYSRVATRGTVARKHFSRAQDRCDARGYDISWHSQAFCPLYFCFAVYVLPP